MGVILWEVIIVYLDSSLPSCVSVVFGWCNGKRELDAFRRAAVVLFLVYIAPLF